MLPTLLGRWQTRLILFIFIGLPVTFLYSLWLTGWSFAALEPFYFLATLLVVGLVLDIVYQQIQRFRWDSDWPFAFFFIFSYVEFFIVYALVYFDLLPYLPSTSVGFWLALLHFTLVFIPSFIAVLACIQLFLVRWRYKGGEIGRLPISE